MDKTSTPHIETANGRCEAEIAGSPAKIVFTWAALTNQICLKLHLDPMQLSFMLPGLIASYQRTLRDAVEFDISALRHRQKGGQP